ncbi:hypothetical protein EPO33_05210 [Patescibacteria group bacterium]|nr:MAG: hypothetical protein EPO33_05210 [Patescibacteria group bacterium]
MTRRQRLIIIGVLVSLVALGIAAFLVLRPAPAVNTPAEQPETPGLPLAPSTNQPVNAPASPATSTPAPTPTFSRASAREILEQQLKTSGAQFAERFGTYSNQGDFQNLIDLFPLMTERMQQQTQRTIDAASAATSTPSTYVGVTTRPVTTTVVSVDETGGRATIRVSAQRATQTGDAQPVTRYETLTIEFRNQQNVWKVDSARWSTP